MTRTADLALDGAEKQKQNKKQPITVLYMCT